MNCQAIRNIARKRGIVCFHLSGELPGFCLNAIRTARQGFTKAQIEPLEVPLPPLPNISAALSPASLQAKMDALRRLQAETGAEPLLPTVRTGHSRVALEL